MPKTIDNDLSGTVATFGFDTAVSTATDAIDKLHSTAEAHERVMVVEVMGRYAGWIALERGRRRDRGRHPHPGDPLRPREGLREGHAARARRPPLLHRGGRRGRQAQGRRDDDPRPKEAGREVLLGGIGQYVADEIARRTGKETRNLVLGHLQRGGGPTTFDRLLGLRFGAAAVRTLAEGKVNVMVALDPPTVKTIPLTAAIERMKSVPLDSDTVLTARALGICLGD